MFDSVRCILVFTAFVAVMAAGGCEVEEEPNRQMSEGESTSCETEATEWSEVPSLVTEGAMRRVNLHNDTAPAVLISEAVGKEEGPNHAVGALGELSGELTVWDDTVYVADAGGGEVAFRQLPVDSVEDELDATLFFGVRAPRWQDVDIDLAGDLRELEQRIENWRADRGIDGAVAFRILDPGADVEWHVVDKERLPDGEPTTCDQRKEYSHQYRTTGEPVRIAGIFTTDHTGVVVDHTSPIHAHVITEDGRNGHVDALELSPKASIEIGVQPADGCGP